MNKFDDFTVKYFKIFMKKRSNEILPGLKELQKQVKSNINKKLKYKIEDYKIPLIKIKKLIDSQWVDQNVINTLDELEANYKITWSYKNIDHTIFIKSTKDKFDNFKDRLLILLNMLNFIHDKKNTTETRPINMYLILTLLKKLPPSSNNKTVGVKNVNSGYTDFISNEILVWREEEFEKVIFHEMIHYMDLDIRNMAFDDKELPHHIDGPKTYYEAFTDFRGNMYNLIYVSLLTKKSVDSLFQIEYQFMKNQANLFNKIFNLKDWTNKKIVKQNTPAFTYYILKYLIFKNVIEYESLDILENPRDLLSNILKSKFEENKFLDLKSTRMTLIQIN